MKKFLLILGALLLIAVVAAAIFIMTFDLDKYRPVVTDQLQKALGYPVQMEHVGLSWRDGLVFEAKGFSVGSFLQAKQVTVAVHLPPLSPAFTADRIDMKEGVIRGENFQIKNVELKGRLTLPGKNPGVLELAPLEADFSQGSFPRHGPGDLQLKGRLSATFKGNFQGLAWPDISKSLAGQGKLTLIDGKVENLNILREVFARLSIIPGLAERIEGQLPDSYREKFTAQDTTLKSVNGSATVANGVIVFDRLTVATDTFEMAGAGQVGLDGKISIQSQIHVEPVLTAAILKGASEFQVFADTQGMLVLPVVIQGTLPKISVLPDVAYVVSHMTTTKVEELVGGLLEKALKKKQKK